MPWSKQTLALPATASSVRRARDWIGDMLAQIGRAELSESARLGVSELVTNALLHAEPPMTVGLRGTVEHPRVEVADHSIVPPQPRPRPQVELEDERTWSTIGRGLDLIACHSTAWGADIDPRGLGKIVWFEPSDDGRDEPIAGAIFDMEYALETHGPAPVDPSQMFRVDLFGFPVELFGQLRMIFSELARELRLLALSSPGEYPVAEEFAELFLEIESERRQARGLDALERAFANGQRSVDLHYLVPPSAPTSMARLSELLDTIYDNYFESTLLAVKPAPELRELQNWYLGEFARQSNGAEPTPWTGPVTLTRRREVS